MKCVNCDRGLPAEAMFCPYCGNSSHNGHDSASFNLSLLVGRMKNNISREVTNRLEARKESKRQKETEYKILHPEFFTDHVGRIVKIEHQMSSDGRGLKNFFIYTIEVQSQNKPRILFYDNNEKQRFSERSQVKFKLNKDYTPDRLELLL